MIEKSLYKIYSENIEDVALDISQTSYWRNKLLKSNYEERILISEKDEEYIPQYIKHIFTELNLMFLVSKTKHSLELFDRDNIIFKFESLPFPSIVRFTGN